MIITQIEIYKSPIKLKEPFVISLGAFEFAENIVVVIKTDESITGFGECSPFMSINGESMDTCFIVAQYLARILKGKDPGNMESCLLAMDKVIYGNTSIKSAFDMALYDIASQLAGLPLYVFLGGKNDKKLITDYTVSFGPARKMADDALKIKSDGFQFIKVKLGGEEHEDIQRIRLIRDTVGVEIPLRIDANQGWDKETAINILNALVPYHIQYCEEPIPRWDFMELPEIKRRSPIPIMGDESCCDHHDAKRLIDLEACDYLNIKLGKSGGIFNAIKMIRLAEKANIKMQIGGFLESRLGFTASAHLALLSDNIEYFDFDTPLMFIEDPVKGGIEYMRYGEMKVPDSPGIGASIHQEYLEELIKVVI